MYTDRTAYCLRERTGNWAFGWELPEKKDKNQEQSDQSFEDEKGDRREQNDRVAQPALYAGELY